jgi:hypothetical protein
MQLRLLLTLPYHHAPTLPEIALSLIEPVLIYPVDQMHHFLAVWTLIGILHVIWIGGRGENLAFQIQEDQNVLEIALETFLPVIEDQSIQLKENLEELQTEALALAPTVNASDLTLLPDGQLTQPVRILRDLSMVLERLMVVDYPVRCHHQEQLLLLLLQTVDRL